MHDRGLLSIVCRHPADRLDAVFTPISIWRQHTARCSEAESSGMLSPKLRGVAARNRAESPRGIGRSRHAESGGVATRNRAESPRGIGRSRRAASSGRTTESTRRPFFVVFAASTYIENRERVSIAVYLDVFLLENIEENIKRTDLRLFCCVSLHRELRNESNRC